MDIEAKVAEMKSPETFDVRSALNGTTYATENVTVYVNAAVMHEANKEAERAADLHREAYALEAAAHKLSAGENGGIVDSEGYEEKAAEAETKKSEAEAAEARVAELLTTVRDSALTFTLKGLPPKQVQLIDKKWRKAIKPPARKNYSDDAEGQEEYELETFERNKDRNESVNHDCIANSILKVTNGQGAVDSSAWKVEDVQNLFETLMETEYEKLRVTFQDLSFAHTLFERAIVEDADF